jgi:hypothetical protein
MDTIRLEILRASKPLNSQTAENLVDSVGPRIGYRWGTNGLYLNPWIAFSTNSS